MLLTSFETRRLLRDHNVDLAAANQAEAEGRLADLFVPVNLSASAVAERCVQGEFDAVLSGAGHADERAVALPHCSLEDLQNGPPEFFRDMFEGTSHSLTRRSLKLRMRSGDYVYPAHTAYGMDNGSALGLSFRDEPAGSITKHEFVLLHTPTDEATQLRLDYLAWQEARSTTTALPLLASDPSDDASSISSPASSPTAPVHISLTTPSCPPSPTGSALSALTDLSPPPSPPPASPSLPSTPAFPSPAVSVPELPPADARQPALHPTLLTAKERSRRAARNKANRARKNATVDGALKEKKRQQQRTQKKNAEQRQVSKSLDSFRLQPRVVEKFASSKLVFEGFNFSAATDMHHAAPGWTGGRVKAISKDEFEIIVKNAPGTKPLGVAAADTLFTREEMVEQYNYDYVDWNGE
jgi:hypothetical protein